MVLLGAWEVHEVFHIQQDHTHNVLQEYNAKYLRSFFLKDKINQESWCFLSLLWATSSKKRKKIDPQIALSRPRLHGDQVDLQGRPGKLLSVTTVVVNGLIRSLQRLNRNQLDYQVVLLLSFEEYIYWPATILDSRNKSFAAVPLDPTFPSPQRNRVQWPPATTCVHMERQWKHTRVSLIGLQSCLYHLLEGKGNIAKQVYMISLIQIGQQLKGLP